MPSLIATVLVPLSVLGSAPGQVASHVGGFKRSTQFLSENEPLLDELTGRT